MTDPTPRFRFRFVLAVLGLGGLVLAAGLLLLEPGGAPQVSWRFGADRATVQPFDRVPMWEPMEVEVDLPFDAFVYVVSFDHVRGTVTYFPTEFLGTDHLDHGSGRMHALPAGRHRLPGSWDGKPQTWYVPNVQEAVSLCVVISREPFGELDELLPLTRQFGNKAFRDRSFGYYMPRAGRDELIGERKLPHAVLQAAQNHAGLEQTMVPWPARPGVFVGGFNILPGAARPGVAHPGNPFAKQLQEAVERKRAPGNQQGPLKIDIKPGTPGK